MIDNFDIKAYRKAFQLSQSEFVDMLNISGRVLGLRSLQDYEANKRPIPDRVRLRVYEEIKKSFPLNTVLLDRVAVLENKISILNEKFVMFLENDLRNQKRNMVRLKRKSS